MASEIKSAGISSDMVKSAVTRTIKYKIEEINHKLNDISENMKYFETKYGMKTEDFYKKFKTGILEDDMDFFEWKASSDIYIELKEEKKALLEAIG